MNSKPKWSRRRWLAELNGTDLSDVTEYQPSQKGRENRLPIFDDDGLYLVVFPGDKPERIKNAFRGRQWKEIPHWRNPEVIIYQHIR